MTHATDEIRSGIEGTGQASVRAGGDVRLPAEPSLASGLAGGKRRLPTPRFKLEDAAAALEIIAEHYDQIDMRDDDLEEVIDACETIIRHRNRWLPDI